MDWSTVISTVVGVLAGGVINAYFARRSSEELRREAEKLRQQSERARRLTINLTHILAASGQIEVSTWDPETDEASSRPVGTKREIRHDVEANEPETEESPTPEDPRRGFWSRLFGG